MVNGSSCVIPESNRFMCVSSRLPDAGKKRYYPLRTRFHEELTGGEPTAAAHLSYTASAAML
jgi:hypothetical protein